MREVEVTRFVQATPPVLERAVAPARVVEYEGSFGVVDVDEEGAATLVEAAGGGIGVRLRFESREDGLYYEQDGDAGPFESMWTRIEWTNEDEGARVTARSAVSLGLPVAAVSDRVGAWKRRGELRRALRRLADDVE